MCSAPLDEDCAPSTKRFTKIERYRGLLLQLPMTDKQISDIRFAFSKDKECAVLAMMEVIDLLTEPVSRSRSIFHVTDASPLRYGL